MAQCFSGSWTSTVSLLKPEKRRKDIWNLKYQESLFGGFTKIIAREAAKYNLNVWGTDEFRQNEGGTEPLGKYAFFFRMKNSYTILVIKLRRSRNTHRWEDNIKMS
jgi:hypothetical protein